MITKYDTEYEDLRTWRRRQEEEDVANKNAVADEIRRALEMAREHKEYREKRLGEMNGYIKKKAEECARIELLDS